jgi:cytochrome c1
MTAVEARKPGRPREDHVPTEKGECPTHGEVTFRVHKNGKAKDGTQRYYARCPDCHNERNQRYHKM